MVLKRPTYTNAHAVFRPRGRQSCSSAGDGKVTETGAQMCVSLEERVRVCVCLSTFCQLVHQGIEVSLINGGCAEILCAKSGLFK